MKMMKAISISPVFFFSSFVVRCSSPQPTSSISFSPSKFHTFLGATSPSVPSPLQIDNSTDDEDTEVCVSMRDEEDVVGLNMVWWDMETAPLLGHWNVEPRQLFVNMKAFAETFEDEPVELYAFGDKNKVGCQLWDELVEGGGTYIHVPSGGDEVQRRYDMITNMILSVLDCRGPTTCFLISDDDHFEVTDCLLKDCSVFEVPVSTAPEYNKDQIWENVARGRVITSYPISSDEDDDMVMRECW